VQDSADLAMVIR